MTKNKIRQQDKGRRNAIEISNPHFARLEISTHNPSHKGNLGNSVTNPCIRQN